MRKLIIALILISGLSLSAQTEYRFNNKTNGFSISNKSNTTLDINYNVSAVTLEDSNSEGLEGQTVTMSGIFIPNQAGAPNLPSSSTYIAIPNGATPSIQMVSAKTKVIENVDLIPAPIPQLDNDNSQAVYEKDMDIYGRNAFYPATPYNISEVKTIRGVEMVQVGVMPFQYNPVTKQLIVYEDIELQLTHNGGNGTYGDIRYRTPGWDHILSDMILNRDALPEVDYGKKLREHYQNRETGHQFIIITPDNEEFVQLGDSIKQFRTSQGIPAEVFTVTQCGGNTQSSIRTFIRNAYNNWDMPPEAVLFLGDHNTDGTQGIVSYTLNNHPGGDGYNPYISDNKYADINNDHLPDIIIGRITGRNYEEMYHIIKKDFDYERTPPTNPDFYDKPVTAMGFQLPRWFQLCSEIVNGFWEHGLGKHPVRINAIYQGTPGSQWSTYEFTQTVLNYFGPNGCGYIPQTMSHLTDWDGTGNMINNCINNGAFLVQHRDHGAEELWGEPTYNISYINRLTNNDLTYVMSNNCLTGRFDYGGTNGGCFAEAFHRHQHGALGLIAATQVSYSFVNDIYVWGAYDNLWPEFMPSYGTVHESNFIQPAFGNVAGKYFLSSSNWTDSSVKQITYYLFHQHGDPYMTLYSEMPQQLEVEMIPVLTAGSGQYQLKVDEGATICITVDGQIIGYGEGTGDIQYIDIEPQVPGTTAKLTITKQNYYRYEHLLNTIPAEGPYLVFDAVQINDENGNQAADYNETCNLNISLHNVGSESISNIGVTMTCNHPKVQILQDQTSFGTIESNSTEQADQVLTVHFDEDFNDGESVRFYLQMENESYTFIDSIDLHILAPVLSCTDISFTNLDGEPTDRFFKGESSLMSFHITNSGHSKSLDLTHQLDIHAPFLDIVENPMGQVGIEAGETVPVTFQVNMHDDAPNGNLLEYTLDAESGVRAFYYENQASLGYTAEDFEDEDLNPNLTWHLGNGSKKWYIVEDETATKGHCLHSPVINSSSANLQIAIVCSIPDNFTFSHKTSTTGGNTLTLMINNAQVDSWSGVTDWEASTFQLNEGTNILKFTYKINSSNGGGDDYVLIDHMLFPPMANLYVFAGDDATTNFAEPFTTTSWVLHQDELLWSTNGDGTFDDPSLERPTYTFGPSDVANRNVTLTVTASRNGVTQSDDLFITGTTAVDEMVNGLLLVYPNPSNGTINIKADDIQSDQVMIRLIDVLGRAVITKYSTVEGNSLKEQINTSTLGSGLYDLQILDGNQCFNTRIVVR